MNVRLRREYRVRSSILKEFEMSETSAAAISPDALKYPIGKFSFPGPASPEQRTKWIAEIAETPGKLRAAVAGLNVEQLDTPYRPGGWTVRQVVHHVPESHMNAYIRFKLALTESEPTIKPYDEKQWAELADSKAPIEPSLALLENLHARWVPLLRSLTPADWAKKFR